MLKLICGTCNNEFLCKNERETNCPTCTLRDTRKASYANLRNFNEALKEMQTRLEFLKDDGVINEEAYQIGLLGISYLQQAGH